MNALNPYSTPAISGKEASSGGYRVSFRRILWAWFCFLSITLIAIAVIALVAGLLLAGLLVAMGADKATTDSIKPFYVAVCSNLVPIPVSLFVYWWTINRIVLKTLTPQTPSAN